jgi:hypothetical protein
VKPVAQCLGFRYGKAESLHWVCGLVGRSHTSKNLYHSVVVGRELLQVLLLQVVVGNEKSFLEGGNLGSRVSRGW